MKEKWKTMIYQNNVFSEDVEVSNCGRLRNKKTGTIYRLYENQRGYLQVCVAKGRKNKRVIRMHKAVAETFLPGWKPGLVVNHIDGNKKNNNAENLEWCTPSQNTIHAYKTGLMPKDINRGEKSHKATLCKTDVEKIRSEYIPRDRQYGTRALGKKYGVDHMTISRIVRNLSW